MTDVFLADLVGVELGNDDAVDSRNTLTAFMDKEAPALPFMFKRRRK